MKLELIIAGVVLFIVINIYYDGKYMNMLYSYKKHFRIIFIIVAGIIFYLMIKRNPLKCKHILLHANNMVKYMPIDKSSMDMISPIIDFTTARMDQGGDITSENQNFMTNLNTNTNTNMNVGGGQRTTKRSVSETKKKYVASMQNWKCGGCGQQLNAWFEVDHKIRLDSGGNNEIQNLVAMCRECHGSKTAMENM
jgi:5-methylcytosine-specific restriction endonuclease McrA